ncbi:four helix bundle protein, partial [Hyella patelloides]
VRYLQIALGSLRELDTQLIIAKKVGLAKPHIPQKNLISS